MLPRQLQALRPNRQVNPEGRTLREDPTVEPSTSALQDGNAQGIEARLDRYKADVLALPHVEQLADLAIAELFIEYGRHLERQALGIAPRPQPGRPCLVTAPRGDR